MISNELETVMLCVTVEDIRKFGMIPEFIGRLPIIYTLEGLSEEMMVKILKEPKNAILKQYQKLLELDEVKLEFTDDSLKAIAEIRNSYALCLQYHMGTVYARKKAPYRKIISIMYEIPKDDNIGRVTITREYIQGTGGPVIEIRGNQFLAPWRSYCWLPRAPPPPRPPKASAFPAVRSLR